MLTPITLSTRKSNSLLTRNWRLKGLTKTEGDNADLYVGYQVAVDQEKQWNAYGMGGGVRFGGMGTATSSTISVATLVLDMYDLRANCR